MHEHNHDLFHINKWICSCCMPTHAHVNCPSIQKYLNSDDIERSAPAKQNRDDILQKLFNKKNHYLIIIFFHTFGKTQAHDAYSAIMNRDCDSLYTFVCRRHVDAYCVFQRWNAIRCHNSINILEMKHRKKRNTSGKNVEVVFNSFMHAAI